MIELNQARLQIGTKILFEDANLSVFPGHKIGIVGRNGCGKSSLFKLLKGELQTDSGLCQVPEGWTIAHVKQETPALPISAVEYVIQGDKQLYSVQQQLKMAESAQDFAQVSELHQQIDSIDGYSATARAHRLLAGLGFQPEQTENDVASFSGGWRMRLNLAQALMERSDLLLLDEPTNHLDIEAIVWMESWLTAYQGTLLVISHDRDFLDNVVSEVCHFAHHQLKLYSGNYTTFEHTRAEQIQLALSQNEKFEKKKAHLEKFINRFKAKASKAKQAQSRVKMLEKMGDAITVQSESRFEFEFLPPKKQPELLLSIQEGHVGYSDSAVIKAINLNLQSGDRIGLLAANGAGKSTLIRTIAEELTLLSGTLERHSHLQTGYFAQHQLDVLDLSASPASHLQRLSPNTSEQEIRNYLGGFGFNNDTVFKAVNHFSGGEKSRLALALLIWQRPNLLLLDEPTNHLDLDMRSALTMALQNYEGALIVVSHDRYFMSSICDQFYQISEQQLKPFSGSLADYQRVIMESTKDAESNTQKNEKTSKKEDKRKAAALRQKLSPIKNEIKVIEKKMAGIDTRLDAINEAMEMESLYLPENKDQLKALIFEQKSLQNDKTTLEDKWMELEEAIEQIHQASSMHQE